jgi:hypothetical protein
MKLVGMWISFPLPCIVKGVRDASTAVTKKKNIRNVVPPQKRGLEA